MTTPESRHFEITEIDVTDRDHEVLGSRPTNPNAHFTIPREQLAYLSGLSMDEFPTSAENARISDGFGDQLHVGTDFVE